MLQLFSAGTGIPHPDKLVDGQRKGVCRRLFGHAGEDAYFCSAEASTMGVADGVFAWGAKGIDAGSFSRALMRHCLNMSEGRGASGGDIPTTEEEGRRPFRPLADPTQPYVPAMDILTVAASQVTRDEIKGSATACVLTLNPVTGQASAANLGDSGVLIGREVGSRASGKHECVFRSPSQEHIFGYPFQLGHHEEADDVNDAQVFEIQLCPGDVVICATDGLFDNVDQSALMASTFDTLHAHNFIGGSAGAHRRAVAAVARGLVRLALDRSMDKRAVTPYARAASDAFDCVFNGGKKDDITVVVGLVAPMAISP